MTSRVRFSKTDDELLRQLVGQYGTCSWMAIASRFCDRSARQCRDRWSHYLAPSANTEQWTHEEDVLLVQKVRECGRRWAHIAQFFKGRAAVSIRNRCCKLSRQKSADPVLKSILCGCEVDAGSMPHTQGSRSRGEGVTPDRHARLPPISSLLALIRDRQIGSTIEGIGLSAFVNRT